MERKEKALVFDFDGVFVKSNELKVKAIVDSIVQAKKAKGTDNLAIENYVRSNFGRGRQKIIEGWLIDDPSADVAKATGLADMRIDPEYEAMTIIDEYEVLKCLKMLKRKHVKLFIVTGSPCRSVYKILEEYSDYFDCIFSTKESFDKSKYLEFIKTQYDVVYYVGDAMGDFNAAKIQDIPFCFIEGDSVSTVQENQIMTEKSDMVCSILPDFLREIIKLKFS